MMNGLTKALILSPFFCLLGLWWHCGGVPLPPKNQYYLTLCNVHTFRSCKRRWIECNSNEFKSDLWHVECNCWDLFSLVFHFKKKKRFWEPHCKILLIKMSTVLQFPYVYHQIFAWGSKTLFHSRSSAEDDTSEIPREKSVLSGLYFTGT